MSALSATERAVTLLRAGCRALAAVELRKALVAITEAEAAARCPECGGTGFDEDARCDFCGGTGRDAFAAAELSPP